MKLKSLFTTALIGLCGTAFGQNWTYDSVALGAGYANDYFYELGQGATSFTPGNNWDLAFQMTVFGEPMFNAAVRANHVKKSIEVYSLGLQGTANWSTLSAADTIGKTASSTQLINDDASWGNGAFYENHLTTDPFSYGWGEYNSSDHFVYGNLIYLVKVGGTAYKFWVKQYTSIPTDNIAYTFRIAKLDGSDDNTVTISRKAGNFTDRLFAYYDIASNTVINREPARTNWDLMFTQYKQRIDDGMGNKIPYSLTGVLTNLYTEVADIRHINPDDVTNFKNIQRTNNTDEIGSDWKSYIMATNQYVMTDSTSFIVKSKLNQTYYQLQFIRFDGSSVAGAGKIVFRKRTVGSALSVPATAANSLTAFSVSPNPASADATLLLDAKSASAAQMVITDMAGRAVQSAKLDLKSGINAYSLNTSSWPAGIYAVQLIGQDWKASSRLVVAH